MTFHYTETENGTVLRGHNLEITFSNKRLADIWVNLTNSGKFAEADCFRTVERLVTGYKNDVAIQTYLLNKTNKSIHEIKLAESESKYEMNRTRLDQLIAKYHHN